MSFTAFIPTYRAAMSLLPPQLDTPNAMAMEITIAMQESRWDERRQIGGPARGFHQFEKGTPESRGGITGVLMHTKAGPLIKSVLDRLDYDHSPQTSYIAIEHNDVLDFCYARCLLWTVPQGLPSRNNPAEGWSQYIFAWNPGRPFRATWDAFYRSAWMMVDKIQGTSL